LFCMSCGTELPEEAKFCWKCGQAVNRAAMAAPQTPFESCTLQACYELNPKSTGGFYCDRWWEARLEGEGQAGSSVLVKSSVVALSGLSLVEKATRNPGRAARARFASDWEAAYRQVIEGLLAQGWEPQAVDREGHATALRRPRGSREPER